MQSNTKHVVAALSVATCTALAQASELNLSVESAGQNTLQVLPGATVDYQVIGELTDAQNEGLAMFAFDLGFDGGALQQADAPTSNPMLNFQSPLGLSNPAGFGGTPSGGDLIQIGGAQNTIKNTLAAKPTGTVMVGVAAPGSPEVLVAGSLSAPATPGSYTLSVSSGFVNVIRQGEDGSGDFWAVDGADLGTVTTLEIQVLDCAPQNYCTAKQASLGCLPSIGYTGSPTLTGADDFHITASDVVSNHYGVLFWGLAPDATPFAGGTRCVSPPQVRTAHIFGGGSVPPSCDGALDFHATQAYMSAGGWSAGTTIYTQYYFRDPLDAFGIGLTDGLQFTVCP